MKGQKRQENIKRLKNINSSRRKSKKWHNKWHNKRLETAKAPYFGGDLEVIFRDMGGNEGKPGGKLWLVK